MSAASQFYVSGPSYVFVSNGPYVVGSGGSATWNFIGWSRNGMTIQIAPSWEEVQVDYAGNEPGAISILGQDARISGTFSRYNEPVLQGLASFGNATAGRFDNNVLGSLMRQEGLDYALLMQCPYFAKPVFGSSGSPMVPGFLFYSCYMVDPHEAVYSIRVKQPNIGFRAVPIQGTITGGNFAETAPYNASSIYTSNLPAAIGGTWPTVN